MTANASTFLFGGDAAGLNARADGHEQCTGRTYSRKERGWIFRGVDAPAILAESREGNSKEKSDAK